MNVLGKIVRENLKEEAPDFNVGDTVKVQVKISEGKNTRLQAFSGVVIAKKGAGIAETFTVRRVAYGQGVERVFPLHSPMVDSVDVERHGVVRRAKLYYLRDKVGKSARIKEKSRY
jgi:large subunit ribosomal protein L19